MRRPGPPRGTARLGASALAIVWGGVILLVTLAHVDAAPSGSPIGSWCLICGERGSADALLNVALFLPFGFAVASLWGWRTAVAAAFLLSASVESIQVVTPGRYPTAGDLVFNTLGGAVGAALVGLLGRASGSIRVPTATARLVGRLSTAGLILVPIGLLAPQAPASEWWVQWTPDLGHMEAYGGRVLDARVDSIGLPSGRMGDDATTRRALMAATDLDVTFVVGPPPARVAPVLAVYSADQRQVLMVGVEGDAVVYFRRTVSAALSLDQPGVRWPGAVTATPGDTVHIRVRRQRGGVCLEIGAVADCGRSLGVRDGWRLLLAGPSARIDPVFIALLGLVWAALAGVPTGLVSSSARSAAAWATAIGLAGGALAQTVPETTLRPGTVAAVVAGALAGWVIAAYLRRRVDPGPSGALWSFLFS